MSEMLLSIESVAPEDQDAITTEYVETTGGVVIGVRRWSGATLLPDEPVALFVHGFGEGAFVWDDAVNAAMPWQSMGIDLRGHGNSNWADWASYQTEIHAQDLVSVVQKLDLRRIVLVGHSLGADVSLRAYARLADRMAGLVIVDYGPDTSNDASATVRKAFTESAQPYSTVGGYHDYLAATRPLAKTSLLRNFAESALRCHVDGSLRLKADPDLVKPPTLSRSGQIWEELRTVRCPVLLLRGLGSSVLRADVARRMVDTLADARLVEVPLAGHSVMLDNPEAFKRALAEFLMCRT